MVEIRSDSSVAPLYGAMADKGLAGKVIHKNNTISLD
jgi:hypothetical protein